jgi:hypothetical protein
MLILSMYTTWTEKAQQVKPSHFRFIKGAKQLWALREAPVCNCRADAWQLLLNTTT